MDRFLYKTERVKTEQKKRTPRRVLTDNDDEADAETRSDQFVDQFAAFLGRQAGLVKLFDDGNTIRYGKPEGDDVYVCENGAFVKASASQGNKRRRRLTQHEGLISSTSSSNAQRPIDSANMYDDCCLSDHVLAAIPLP